MKSLCSHLAPLFVGVHSQWNQIITILWFWVIRLVNHVYFYLCEGVGDVFYQELIGTIPSIVQGLYWYNQPPYPD